MVRYSIYPDRFPGCTYSEYELSLNSLSSSIRVQHNFFYLVFPTTRHIEICSHVTFNTFPQRSTPIYKTPLFTEMSPMLMRSSGCVSRFVFNCNCIRVSVGLRKTYSTSTLLVSFRLSLQFRVESAAESGGTLNRSLWRGFRAITVTTGLVIPYAIVNRRVLFMASEKRKCSVIESAASRGEGVYPNRSR